MKMTNAKTEFVLLKLIKKTVRAYVSVELYQSHATCTVQVYVKKLFLWIQNSLYFHVENLGPNITLRPNVVSWVPGPVMLSLIRSEPYVLHRSPILTWRRRRFNLWIYVHHMYTFMDTCRYQEGRSRAIAHASSDWVRGTDSPYTRLHNTSLAFTSLAWVQICIPNPKSQSSFIIFQRNSTFQLDQ